MTPNAKSIDVFHGDGLIDWAKVLAAGYSWAYVKATEGISTIDPMFKTNWAAMGEVGITRAAYHFFHPDQSGNAQAKFLLSQATLVKSDLPFIVDVEKGNFSAAALTVCLTVLERETGKVPWIYTSPGYWNTQSGNTLFSRYPVIVAHYRSPSATAPSIPFGFKRWDAWQKTAAEDGASPYRVKVPGCPNGFVDTGVYNGSHEDMVKRFGLA